jgi:hypothetical protein
MEMAVDGNPAAYVFAGETGQPLWRSSLLEDHISAKLLPVGLGWVNFQVTWRPHASQGHRAKVNPKVAADQRGHGIGVALDVYTKSTSEAGCSGRNSSRNRFSATSLRFERGRRDA